MTTRTARTIAATMIDLDPSADWDDASIVDIARDLGVTLDASDVATVRAIYAAKAALVAS